MIVGKILHQRYHIIAQINNNELCKTYIALDRTVASEQKYIIKHFLPPERDADEILAKWLKIANRLLQLNGLSDRISRLFQYWLQENHLFLAYEHIDGSCLSAEFSPGKIWPEHFVIDTLAEIGAALQPLHQQHMGHGNLHLRQLIRRTSDQKIVLTDVGLLGFTQPEPVNDRMTIQQDLQAIGEIAIRALTGLSMKQLTADSGTIDWHPHAHCSLEFSTFIDRLMTSDPHQQWPSALPMVSALEQIIDPSSSQPTPAATAELSVDMEIEIEEMKKQADLKFIQGNAAGAVDDYGEIIQRDPQAMYYHNRAIIYAHALGNYELALQDHDTTIALKPDFASAHQNRAYTQRMLGNLAAAIQDYNRSLELVPNTATVYWERGVTYQQLGNLTSALADYTQFLTYQPYHAEAYHQRGNVRQKLGDLEAAKADYDRAIEIDPLSIFAYYDRGGLHARQSDFTAAIADYTKVLDLDPMLVSAYNNRGIIKRHQGDLTGAIADYNCGLNIDPNSIDCLRNRGIARQQLKDYAGAIADYQRAANMYLRQGQSLEYEKIIKIIDLLQRCHLLHTETEA